MDIISSLIKNITYPLWMLREGKTGVYASIREYRNIDRLPVEVLKERQFEKIKKIVHHAYETTEYYDAAFRAAGFEPGDLRHADDLSSLPAVTKEQIRESGERMVSRSFDAALLAKDSTGGSTGVPMVFYRDEKCWKQRRAQELFFDRWAGYDLGKKVAYFVAGSHHPGGLSGIKARIRNATRDRILAFDPGMVSDGYMAEFARRFRAFKPDMIKCFPNALYLFADYLKRNRIDDLSVEAVTCTGENLYPYQKELIEEVFHCRVFEKYGTRECGVIACECSRHDGMHVFSEGAYLEIVNNGAPARPGEMGEIVVTDLFNYGMPLIRYKVGDVAVATDRVCACGSNFPLIGKLIGRDRDVLVAQDGSPKPGYLFVEIVNKNDIPAQCQFIQEDDATLLVNIVRLQGFRDEHVRLIEGKCKSILGNAVAVNFAFKDAIPREKSGKFKYVSSNVKAFSPLHG